MSEKFECLAGFKTVSDEELATISGGGFGADFFGALFGSGAYESPDDFLRRVNGGYTPSGYYAPTSNGYSGYNPYAYWY
jgi:bacteriocin-like protein